MKFLFFFFVSILFVSCSICEKAEVNGPRDLLMVSKFNQIFEKHSEKIGQHRGIGEGEYWESKGLIYGRYLVILNFKVKVGNDCSLSRESKPIIRVMEYYDYTGDSEGHGRAKGRMVGDLSEEEFMSLASADGIFEFIDVNPVKDQPVSGIENVLEFW